MPTGISSPSASVLDVNCTQGRIITFQQASPTFFLISDNVQGEVAQVNRSAFKTVNVIVQGQDTIDVNDSNGMPFLLGTAITAEGFGTNNSLDLFGNRAIDTGENYSVANTTATNSTLVEDNLTFTMTRAITSVTDVLQDTGGPLVVSTSGNDVILSNTGNEQTLFNLGSGGGGTLLRRQEPGRAERERCVYPGLPRSQDGSGRRTESSTLNWNALRTIPICLGHAGQFHNHCPGSRQR